MNITFYESNNPVNLIDKVLSNGVTKTGALREGASILTPVFNVESAIIPTWNYCYIPDFKRYYYITDITSVKNGLVRIECKVDVLKSFSAEIRQSLAKSKRAISNNAYYDKVDIGQEVRTTGEKINFPNTPFDETGSIILVAINGTGVI